MRTVINAQNIQTLYHGKIFQAFVSQILQKKLFYFQKDNFLFFYLCLTIGDVN